jgi:hypothetical protein
MPTCRLETSDLVFPFGCPLNFLLNVHFMQVSRGWGGASVRLLPPRSAAAVVRQPRPHSVTQGLEVGHSGQHGLPYREHSFLNNSRLGSRLRTSRTTVHIRKRADADAERRRGAATLPRGATDAEVVALLGPGSEHDETAVLELDDAEGVLGGFEDAEKREYVQVRAAARA